MQSEVNATAKLSEARRALLQRYLRGGMAGVDTKPATIPKRIGSRPVPLSYSQQQIWVHSQLAGESLIYNEPVTIRRQGELNIPALERSFAEIVRRHEAWRTTFLWDGNQVVQIIHPAPARSEIPFIDLRAHRQPEQEALRLATEDARQSFDLARGPMYRLRLVRVGEMEHRLFLTLHHIIFDGVSLYRVLLPELLTSYEAFTKNESPVLSELPIQYPDYATWQRDSIKEIPPEQLPYWQAACDDLPVLDLITDRPRPTVQTYAGAMQKFQVSHSATSALKAMSQDQGVTPFMTMVAAFTALLHGYTGQEDIVMGGVSSGRDHVETEGLLGCFLNTVVIRCAFSKDLPFTELLSRARRATLGALSHDGVPFELLVQKFVRQRDPSRAPLVQALIVVEPPLTPLKKGWAFTHVDVDTGTSKFDLQLGLDDRPEGLTGSFIYNTDLFEPETIEVLKSRWLRLLDRIAVAPTQRVRDLTAAVWRETECEASPSRDTAEDAERQKLLVDWNDTRTNYPRSAAIHEVFEEQARRASSSVALVFHDARLTYDELNRRANRLARRLQKLGVGRDLPVGVCMDRSPEMVTALLAVLKAGGAYVPLDPAYPAERLALMIEDTGMAVVLTHTHVRNRCADASLAVPNVHALCIDAENFTNEDETNLAIEVRANDLAYVMYTSGSTGTPKGVAVTHRGVVRLVKNTQYASFSSEETFLQLAPISFDASTFEIWGPLLNGGKLAVMSPAPPSLEEIGNAIREYGVTTLWLTAGLFNAMVDERLDDLRPLRQLLAGGDVLSVPHVGKVLQELKNTRLINGYGPTESTTFACCHTIAPDALLDGAIPIGKPIANTTVYILDANLQLVPVGVSGELFIGGDGLARGYWRREELTAEKFVSDPFSTEPGARLYKTGDRARWRSDGVIEFLGRADNQIKFRGYRIEPGEIEIALKHHPDVLDSAAIMREDTPSDKRLVAYVVRKPSARIELEQSALIAALKKSLPDYLVPSAIIALPALPRTPNGKLDRNALPAPYSTKPTDSFVAPQTPLEEKIAAIWTDVLGVERVGMTDNFFDLGGHSLLGLRLVNQLREALGANLALAIVFEAPTAARMADLLEKNFPAAVARWIGRNVDADAATNQSPAAWNSPALAASRPLASVVPVDRESRRVRRPRQSREP
jgi:aspartate racemase